MPYVEKIDGKLTGRWIGEVDASEVKMRRCADVTREEMLEQLEAYCQAPRNTHYGDRDREAAIYWFCIEWLADHETSGNYKNMQAALRKSPCNAWERTPNKRERVIDLVEALKYCFIEELFKGEYRPIRSEYVAGWSHFQEEA